MITFASTDYDKQFISIIPDDSTSIDAFIDEIKNRYPALKGLHIIFDEAEILIPIESGIAYGFSLKELREYTPIAAATVSYFAVALDSPNQRWYG